mmetsp:Transcript_10736/g.16427  ORF Transcript_10736/g.16427 Transcript_10736/m.16427 type:complete len:1219 (+) Transcript_10736:101-3757(+)
MFENTSKLADIMFEKTLTDIVKGIRGSKRDTALYISQCIAEIKQEINSTDLYVKANALNKLTFLQMMGYGMSYASFASIEVMSSPRFAHKRIGYLAACQGFNQNTEVILLTTNLLQKELRSAVGGIGMYETGLAINCISNIVTEDLARDVLPELTNLTSHPQPYLRKKAVLCLFKLFMRYPQALRLTFDKIQKCLEDSNSSVVSCAVNVVTELSDKNAKNYLHLAPAFFQLLTQSQNNWMLIKVVKLLGSLVPEEPRLARKLLEPLAAMVQSTQAKSLLYESVYTISLCLPYCRKADGSMPASVPAILQLCGKTLREFCADKDQNLKYLGLVGFSSLRQSHPKCLMESDARPLILSCLSDEDITIRKRALDLLPGMTSRKNLQELIEQLLTHVEAATGQYRKDLVLKIIQLCSSEKYALLQDFPWYLDILFKLSFFSLTDDLGELIGKQITDVALRVLPVRPYAVKTCCDLLAYPREVKMLPQVLPATAWVVGEYADLLETTYRDLVQTLTSPSNVGQLPFSTQSVYLQASLKIFAAATEKATDQEVVQCVDLLTDNLPVYMQSLDAEIQERAFTGLEIMKAFNLTSDQPGLTTFDNNSAASGNLLGMTGDSKPTKSNSSSIRVNLVSTCRSTAASLNFIFKPEPMKPISSKAQRKKSQSPKGGIDLEWLTAPVDLGVFSRLDDTPSHPKPSMEQISFTQQQQQPSRQPSVQTAPVVQQIGLNDMMEKVPPRVGPDINGSESTGLNQSRPQDPFYLDAGNKAMENDNPTEGAKFGTIQLLGSEDEEENLALRKKRKKDKKRKKQKPAKDFGISNAPTMAVYDSGDDDDDNYAFSSNKTKSAISKDFLGLASVDLTKPLAEDEIMPKREHRQVPQKPAIVGGSRDVKKKKRSGKKKFKKDKDSSGGVNEVGDLLDLGGFSLETGAEPSQMIPVAEADMIQSKNASEMMNRPSTSASSVFDDLLGLEALSAPATIGQILSMNLPPAPSSKSKKTGKKFWMKAIVKNVTNDGSSSIDWNKVSVHYKITPKANGGDTFITIRVDNEMTVLPLTNLSVNLKTHGQVTFGTVAAKSSKEKKKIGPFKLEKADSSTDLKGTLSAMDNCKVSVKITLPASLNCTPTPNLTLDGVMRELSNEQFASSSSKVDLSNIHDADQVKAALSSFFNASLVEDSWMLAAQSVQGAKVRVLLKIRDNSTLTVDIKSTNTTLCKSLATDVKKLLL